MAKNIVELYLHTNAIELSLISIDLEQATALEQYHTKYITIFLGTQEFVCCLDHPNKLKEHSAETCVALYKRLVACWREGHQNFTAPI